MRIIIINLDRDSDRLAWMQGQCAAQAIAFERFRARQLHDLTAQERAYLDAPARAGLRDGEKGCLTSHIATWRIAAASEAPVLIMEDDLHFAEDFGDFLRALRIDDGEVAIHRLETFLPRVTVTRAPRFTCGARNAYRLRSNHGGAAAYILTAPAARALLELIDRFRNNVDVELFDPGRGAASAIPTYQWIPAPCIQDQWVSDAAKRGLGSNIVERLDIDTGAYAPRPEPVKDALRPLYTALYDAALAPKGLARKFVPFG